MRDLIVTENITLDGVIDATEGWFNPAGDDAANDQSDVEAALREQFEAADALLLGRVTFEQMRGYWPLQTDDTTGITNYLNNVSKYVVSSTLRDPRWEHTAVLDGALVDEIQALKSEPGRDIVTTGSMTVVRELIAPDWSTSIACSYTQSCPGAACGCSRTRLRFRACVWCRPGRFAEASCFCATGRSGGAPGDARQQRPHHHLPRPIRATPTEKTRKPEARLTLLLLTSRDEHVAATQDGLASRGLQGSWYLRIGPAQSAAGKRCASGDDEVRRGALGRDPRSRGHGRPARARGCVCPPANAQRCRVAVANWSVVG
jgi:dihydrofolate reductase